MRICGVVSLWFSFVILLVLSSTEACPEDSRVQGNLNGYRTECVKSAKTIPYYLTYRESDFTIEPSPVAVGFVKDQIQGFELLRDREVEDRCPTFSLLEDEQIDQWQTSTNVQDQLRNSCFAKYITPTRLLPFRLIYKIDLVDDSANGNEVEYVARKFAVSTPGGNKYLYFNHTEDVAQVCTTCRIVDINRVLGQRGLVKGRNLTEMLRNLKRG